MPAIGARKIEYPAIKERKVEALLRIFHGTITQPPMIAAMMQPLKMFTHLGKRTVRSFAAEMELAVIEC